MTMGSAKNNSRFLGLNLNLAGEKLAAALRRGRADRNLALFVPSVPVRVLGADGQEAVWITHGPVVGARTSNRSAVRFTGVELPEDYLLLRTMQLPSLSDQEIAQAAKLDAQGASPFPLSDLVWGYSALRSSQGPVVVRIAMASRLQVSSYLETVAGRAPAGQAPEVWAISEGFQPIVVGGFGETRRLANASLRQRGSFALLLLAAVTASLIAATPALQLRFRAVEAVVAYEASVKRAEPLVRQRAELSRTVDKVVAIKAVLSERSDPLYVMALLTDALPDDTSLLGVQIQGSKVSINGLTPNAAALMQQLGSRPELRDVKAPTAATRSPGSPKDVFNIEFTLIEKPAPGSGPASGEGAMPLPADASRLPASAAAPVASALSLPAVQSPPLVSAPSDARSAPASSQAPIGSSPLDGPVFGAPDRPSTLPPKTR